MLYIEYNFYRWLATVGPTVKKLLGQHWTDGCADVGPTSVRWRNVIWGCATQVRDLNFSQSALQMSSTQLSFHAELYIIIILIYYLPPGLPCTCVRAWVTQFSLKLLQLHIFGKLLVLMNFYALQKFLDLVNFGLLLSE